MSSKLVHAILIACKAFLPAYIEDEISPLVCELSIVGDPAAAASEVRWEQSMKGVGGRDET